ncbi:MULTISPECIES: hypothetical protein [unclassified Streptomyces]|uniref:hypothetical protein n=1 Tax=unclassified Streptomyces TaxID=2593676 RepID=UPI000CD591C2|nr:MULTISPECIES: hypothetical protein [unclassified Streptomyces]AWL38714.1 hypothetical protein B9S64_11760 [Streptomyces sp. SM18]
MKTRALYWGACAALVVAITGCSGDSDERREKTLSASQVCDGTLTTPAADALERIGGTASFTELDGTDGEGDPNSFSVELAAKRLHSELGRRNECVLYKAGDQSGIYLLKVRFEPTESRPNPESSAKNGKGGDDSVAYPIGLYAYTPADSGAYLYFSCPTKGPEGDTPYVMASMFSSENQTNPDSTGKDRMAVLNDVSRALAKELGCAAQAELPAEVPDPASD